MYSYLLQDIKDLRERKEYKELTGVSKNVVKYLLSEVEEMVQKEKIATSKRCRMVQLFELRFSSIESLIISSIYKSGAAHIKCFKDCKGNNTEATIEAIKTVCDILEWKVELSNTKLHSASRNMEISISSRNERTP